MRVEAGVRKRFCQAVRQYIVFTAVKRIGSSVREGLRFRTDRSVAENYTYPELTPITQAIASRSEVKVGPLVYRILSTKLDRSIPGKFSLWFTIRLTARDWPELLRNDSFRLLVDGVPRAPEGDPFLNEYVPSNSAVEGTIRFVVPSTVADVKLQIIGGGVKSDEWPLIPINLKAAKP